MAAPKVLLIGWDSADWNVASPLLDQGELPHLERLVSSGVMGNLSSIEPLASPALWTSLATGRRPADHGVLGFAEVSADMACVRPVTRASRRVPAIWESLSECGFAAHVVGWPATQGEQLDGGSVVADWFPAPTAGPGQLWPPPPPGTVSPQRIASLLDDFRVSPEEIDADMIRLFVPLAAEVNQEAESQLQRLRVYLAYAFSIQAAATWLLENVPWDFMAIRFGALGAICRQFMPYHPPRLPDLPQRRFKIYNDVVHSAYRLHDLMLGRLIALAGAAATVVVASPHGYHSGSRRPDPHPASLGDERRWLRPQGTLAASGPGLLTDELVHGAGLLDVAPTLLALYQLPISPEMPGRILRQAFQQPSQFRAPSVGKTHRALQRDLSASFGVAPDDAAAALTHCRSVDYLGPFSDAAVLSPEAVVLETQWTLAQSLIASGDLLIALPIVEELYLQWPERSEFGQALSECQLAALRTDAARQTIEATIEYLPERIAALLLRARFAYRTGAHEEALDYLTEARGDGGGGLALYRLLVLTLLALRRWKDAEEICRRIMATDADEPLAHLGLAESLLRQGRIRLASESAMAAIGLNFELAPAHFVLGVAQWRRGDVDSAVQALQTAILLAPRSPLYHRMLSIFYRQLGEPDRAADHMAASHRLLAGRRRRPEAAQAGVSWSGESA